MGGLSIDGAATGSYPGTGDDPYDDKYPDGEDRIEQEARAEAMGDFDTASVVVISSF